MEPSNVSALARSSPWRWSTLRYAQQWDPSGRDEGLVRVLIRRTKLARVECLDGALLLVLRDEPQTVSPLSRDGNARPVELSWVSDALVGLDITDLGPKGRVLGRTPQAERFWASGRR